MPLSWTDRCDLAIRYAPRLVLFPEQRNLLPPGEALNSTQGVGDYHPRGIEPLLERSEFHTGLFKPHQPATLGVLAASTHDTDQLRLLKRLVPDPAHAWQSYFDILDSADQSGRTGRERYPVMVYARVQTRAEAMAEAAREQIQIDTTNEVGRPFFQPDTAQEDDLSIQYWLCYYYDDWANQHEGNWEGITLLLRRTPSGWEPAGAGYNAHETGMRRHWSEINRSTQGGAHPLVFVAAGSHASYFQHVELGYFTTVPGFIIPFLSLRLKFAVSSTRVDQVADDRSVALIEPQVEVLPDPIGPDDPQDRAWQHKKWISFPGSWGMRLLLGLAYGGPTGPSHKGLKWHNPFVWVERTCTPDFLVY